MAPTAESVVAALKAAEKTVATAESCTGGLLGKLLTDVAGSSAVYPGGVISYSCDVKRRYLGVDKKDLDTLGPVSKPVARQMAEGVRAGMKADFGIGITGLAGPDSDGSGRPVGLVYVALAGDGWTICEELHLTGDRAAIRQAAAGRALELVWEALQP